MFNVALLTVAFVVYSGTAIFSKLASQHEIFSSLYLVFFSCVLISLGIYAVLWQKVLAFMSLNRAYLCKSITIVIIICISHFLFGETITERNLIGAIFIIGGLFVLSWKP